MISSTHAFRRRPEFSQSSVSQSVSHSHTPSKEHTAHTHTLLWSSFKCAARISTSSPFFWKVVVLQDGPLLLSTFYLSSCWRRSCRERTSAMDQSARWKFRVYSNKNTTHTTTQHHHYPLWPRVWLASSFAPAAP